MNASVMEGRILSCSYICFLLISQGVKNLSAVGGMGNVDGSLTSSGVLIHYSCLGLATSVSKQYIQFSAAKLKLECSKIWTYQIFRKRTDLQEMLRPENWVWSKLLWQHFMLALSIHSHRAAQHW